MGAEIADIILPSAAFIEENGTFVNVEGRAQACNMVTRPVNDARENWQILRALSEYIENPLHYDSFDEIRFRLGQTIPHILKHDWTESFSEFAQPKSSNYFILFKNINNNYS